ncbi:MAG: hypothetical protein GQ574_16350 [Crocinitomix sp.]|nr:hypothetical protein [Crocinitomix sp.]
MRNLKLHILFVFIGAFAFGNLQAQELNYNKINVQGQLMNATASETDFEFLVLSITGDTLWRESHSSIPLSEQGAFTLPFGSGTFIAGEVSNFHEMNWLDADRVELYHFGDSRYLQGSFDVQAVPYAMHSLYLASAINTSDLADVDDVEYLPGHTLYFDGTGFSFGMITVGDTAEYAWVADHVIFADTAWYALNNDYADTAMFSYFSDSANYATYFNQVFNTDSAAYADSTNYAFSSTGNWSIFGDSDLADTNFVGSTVDESFILKTNNIRRFVFADNFSTHNNLPGDGFRIGTTSGLLITPNTNPGIDEIDGSFFYYDGETNSVHGGTRTESFDTLKGPYSFAWGENVATNGSYSTVFGKDTYGDTAYFGGDAIPYPSISSFAAGKDCHVAHMSFAFGENAVANYYRNVAIGKDVTANVASAGLGVGNNILVEGATAWAMGRNLTANGHFSTVIGSNASADSKVGCFLYGDNSTTDTVRNTANHQFMVRADGGVVFYTNSSLSMGVQLLAGAGSWSMISDRNKKRNITLLTPLDFSPQFDSLSVLSWNYIGHNTAHIGPIAQDFYSTFGYGEKPYLINMIDSDGTTFLGIKKLNEEINNQPEAEEVEEIEIELENEKARLDAIEQRINELYEELDHN